MSITLLGILAGALTSCAFIPQAYKVIKTKRTEDISIPMYTLCTIGVFIWILYGIFINDLAILLTNIVTFIPTLIILILTVKYHFQNKRTLFSDGK
jgi:MtN3 and saliva related transmembrane protein